MDNLSRGKFVLFLSAAFFVVAVSAKVGLPFLEWDALYFEIAKNWASGFLSARPMDHPPLYLFYLALPFHFFGASPEMARMFNMFPVLVTAGLVYLTAKNLSGRSAGIIAASLFLLNPVTIQGAHSLDSSDSTLLPLFFALISYCLSRPYLVTSRRGLVLAVLIAFSFWAKVTSSIALIAGVILYLPVFRGRVEKTFRAILMSGVSYGVLIFLVTWSAASLALWGRESWLLVLELPFRYLSPAQPFSGGGNIFKWGLDFVRLIFWFSPFLLYLAFIGIRGAFIRGVSLGALHFLAFTSLFYFFGYIIAGGSNYGFPRYHAAISPLLHVFVGIALAEIASRLSAAGIFNLIVPGALCAASTVIYIDPELLINLKLKQILFSGSYLAILNQILFPLFVYTTLPFAAALLFAKWRGLKISKAAFAVAAFAALCGTCAASYIRQVSVPYSTAYQYGASGKAAVLKMVSGKLSEGETVLATPEFIYDLRAGNVSGPGWGAWQSEREMYNYVLAREPVFIIAGWTTHTLAQLQYLLKDAGMRELLETKYVLYEIGTYFVWESRRGIPSPAVGRKLTESKMWTGA